MSSHSQNSGTSSDVIPLPSDSLSAIRLNGSKREGVFEELDSLRDSFLEWPTVEGLEAFVEKKTEFNGLVDEVLGHFQVFTREHIAYVGALQRRVDAAEERRIQEFHRALENMSPAEAEAARQAERERALGLEKKREIIVAELDAKIAREKARIREKFPQYYK